MTTLEIINKEIAHCEKESIHWKEKCNVSLSDYYKGRAEAYRYAQSLIETDRYFNNYSF